MLEQKGAMLIEVNSTQERLDLQLILNHLWRMGIRKLMVEGGGQVISSFITSGLVDFFVITIAAEFLGGYNVIVDPKNFKSTSQLHFKRVELLGRDLVAWGVFANEN